MASSHRNRTPSTLEPYLALPPAQSLTLLTNTLGCSANWLTSRFAISALNDVASDSTTSVVLVSWARDAAFWKDELRRAAGLDTSRTPSFLVVDMLAESLSSTSISTSTLSTIEKKITTALAQAAQTTSRILLILDYPSLLLVTTPSLTSTALSTLLLTLRSHPAVHSTLLTTPADGPFLSATQAESTTAPTPIESEAAAFAVQQAHCARSVMSVRELGTGAARDVSGVLRVTKGGSWEGDGDDGEVREWEGLYLVGRDGSVKIVE